MQNQPPPLPPPLPGQISDRANEVQIDMSNVEANLDGYYNEKRREISKRHGAAVFSWIVIGLMASGLSVIFPIPYFSRWGVIAFIMGYCLARAIASRVKASFILSNEKYGRRVVDETPDLPDSINVPWPITVLVLLVVMVFGWWYVGAFD